MKPQSKHRAIVIMSSFAALAAIAAAGALTWRHEPAAGKGTREQVRYFQSRNAINDPVSEALVKRLDGEYRRACDAWKAKNYKAAAPLFQDIIKSGYGGPLPRMQYAQMLEEQGGDSPEAYEAMKGVVHPAKGSGSTLELDPTVWVHFARLAGEFGDADEAMDAFRHTLKICKPSLGGQFPAVDTGVTDPDEVRAAAYVAAGITHSLRGERQVAMELDRLAIGADPDSAVAHFYLGHELKRAGRSDEARVQYAMAKRLGGKYSAVAAAVERETNRLPSATTSYYAPDVHGVMHPVKDHAAAVAMAEASAAAQKRLREEAEKRAGK